MEKYGVDQREVDELVKLGSSQEEALAIVARGDGKRMIKEAAARKGVATTGQGSQDAAADQTCGQRTKTR